MIQTATISGPAPPQRHARLHHRSRCPIDPQQGSPAELSGQHTDTERARADHRRGCPLCQRLDRARRYGGGSADGGGHQARIAPGVSTRAYDTQDFVAALKTRRIVPHIARNTGNGRCSVVPRAAVARPRDYGISQNAQTHRTGLRLDQDQPHRLRKTPPIGTAALCGRWPGHSLPAA